MATQMDCFRSEFLGMPRRSDLGHALAAEAHEQAARTHRLAAQKHARGEHAAAREFSQQAVKQARAADRFTQNAELLTDDATGQLPPLENSASSGKASAQSMATHRG